MAPLAPRLGTVDSGETITCARLASTPHTR
jgi:hypothetical protein